MPKIKEKPAHAQPEVIFTFDYYRMKEAYYEKSGKAHGKAGDVPLVE